MKRSQKKKFDWYGLSQRFSIRKYHFGAASVLLGTALILGNGVTASANTEEQTAPTIVNAETPAPTEESAPAEIAAPAVAGAETPAAETPAVTPAVETPAAVTVDKSALQTALDAAKATDTAGKTAASVEALKTAIAKAEAVIADTAANQEAVNLAKAELEAAVAGLADETLSVAPQEATEVPVATPAAEIQESTVRAAAGLRSDLTVEFLDANNNPITGYYDGLTGSNMPVKVRITLPENATNKTATVTLGNFLYFSNYGQNDDVVKGATTAITAPTNTTTGIVADNGQPYQAGTRTVGGATSGSNYNPSYNPKVTYTIKDGQTSFVLPLSISSSLMVGFKGVATDGEINGTTNGIETSTPITVKLSATENGLNIEDEFNLSEILFSTIARSTVGLTSAVTIVPAENAAATNQNNYIAQVAGVTAMPSSGHLPLIEEETVDIVLPKGVSFESFAPESVNEWDIISPAQTDASGVTRLTVKTSYPTYTDLHRLNFNVKVDRATLPTVDRVNVRLENYQSRLRNYDTIDSTNVLANNTSITYGIQVFELSNQDNLGLFYARPGVVNYPISSIDTTPADSENLYTSLGSLPYGVPAVTNFNNTDSREKEIHYSFPENPSFEVKGIQLPVFNNGYTLSTVKVASKNSPTLREVTLPQSYTYNVPPLQYASLKDLGLSEDDVLTELIVPVGVFAANQSYELARTGLTQVFGKYLAPTTTHQTSAVLTLRDKDYDPNDSTKNYTSGSGELKINLREEDGTNHLRTTIGSASQTIGYAKEGTINYSIRSDNGTSSHLMRTKEGVEKAYLVLPKGATVKSVTFTTVKTVDGQTVTNNITSEVVAIGNTVDGSNVIYEYDLSKVAGENRYVGWVGSYDSHFGDQRIDVAINIENATDQEVTVPYSERFFVTTSDVHAKTGTFTKRGSDPFNLVADDTTIFTNIADTRTLTLSKADKLDLTTEAKLSTDPAYQNANADFKILDITQDLDLKLNIGNKLETSVGELDLFLPIPKKGENWGTNFQTEAFDFGFVLKGIGVDTAFTDAFDITYASVNPTTLDGRTHTTVSLATENFTSTQSSTTNLIRIKTKTGQQVPASSDFPIILNLGLDSVTRAEDGKTITWNPYYSARYATSSSVDKAREINISVTLGKIGATFFNDTDANGVQGASDSLFTAAAPTFVLTDASGTVIDTTGLVETTATGGVVIKGLTSGQTYTAKFIAPTGYRFTTGAKGTDATTTTQTFTAAMVDADNTTLVPVGLTPIITLVNPDLTIVDNIANVSAIEKEDVKAAILAKNTFPAGTNLTVAANGTTTITYVDGFTQTIPGTQTVQQRATSETPVVNAIDNDDTKVSGTGVAGAQIVVTLPSGQQMTTTVKNDGNWEVTPITPLAVGQTVQVTQKETDKLISASEPETVVANQATATNLTAPEKTPVANTSALTPTEQAAVKAAVIKANPTLTDGMVAVDDKGNVTVTYTDGSKDTFTPAETVVQSEASKNPLTAPEKTPVQNTSALTPDEQNAVKAAVIKANPTLTDGMVAVDDKGNVTVTYSDSTTNTLTPDKTVKLADSANPANAVKDPALTPVANLAALTPEEQAAVKAAVSAANPDIAPSKIAVSPTGEVTVTHADGTTTVIPADRTVELSDAASTNVVAPSPLVPVANTSALTPEEKAAVEAAIKAANPKLPADAVISVGPDGTVTVTYADKTTDVLPGAQVVKQSDAVANPLTAPALTPVANTSALTPDEQNAVKAAVKAANPTLQDSQITVDAQGNVTVSYPDGTTNKLTPTQTVKLADSANPANALKDPALTPVANTSALTPEEKLAVAAAVLQANPTLSPSQIAVSPTGEVTVTYADKSTATIPANKTVELSDAASTDVAAPSPLVPVANTSALTPEEKAAVEAAIKAANPNLPTDAVISVGPDGTVTVTYADKTTDVLPGTQVVKQSDAAATDVKAPAVTPVQNLDALTQDEKDAVKAAVIKANPTLTDGMVAVDDKGNVTITYADKTVDTIPASQTVKLADSANPANAVKDPATLTPVGDLNALTPEEQAAVKAAVSAANPNIAPGNIAVDDKGNVTVTFPDGTTTVIPADRTVELSDAASTDVVAPTTKVPVADATALTEAEKAAVIAAIKDANPNLPTDAVITVAPDGTVTVTYADGTKDVLPGTEVVSERPATTDPEVNPIDSDDTTISGKGTPGATITVKFPDGSSITTKVLPDGTWTVPVMSDLVAGDDVVVSQEAPGQKPSAPVTSTVNPTQAEALTPVGPAEKVPVTNPDALTPAEKQAVEDAVRAANPDLPAGTTITADDKGNVTITYPDKTTDVIPASETVVAKSKADIYAPTGNVQSVEKGATVDPKASIANAADLPADTTFEFASPVDTTTVGTKSVTVLVKYADGSVDEVVTSVVVKDSTNPTPAQSEVYTPTVKGAVTVEAGKPLNEADIIAQVDTTDLPANTEVTVKTVPSTDKPGEFTAVVVVKYPDGSVDEVNVPVVVTAPATTADAYTPVAKEQTVAVGATPVAKDSIANVADLPADATYTWKRPVDTSTPGTKSGVVVVTYADGSTDEVTVSIVVEGDGTSAAEQNEPTVNGGVTVTQGQELTDQAILDQVTVPAGGTAVVTVKPSTDTVGEFTATVVVTYADGSSDVVTVPVSVVKPTPISDTVTPTAPATKVPVVDPTNLTPAEKQQVEDAVREANPDLPTGTIITVDPAGNVTLTYPDGSTDKIPAADIITVIPKKDLFTPEASVQSVEKGATVDPKASIVNAADLPAGTTFEFASPVDTTTVGIKSVTVLVKYPDGSVDEVPVVIVVVDPTDPKGPIVIPPVNPTDPTVVIDPTDPTNPVKTIDPTTGETKPA
uniref:Rib/alpha-like domain-containing protein n=1 Tax=Streptococcus plurextorum TaxID=456876 RepID=UPI000564E2EA